MLEVMSDPEPIFRMDAPIARDRAIWLHHWPIRSTGMGATVIGNIRLHGGGPMRPGAELWRQQLAKVDIDAFSWRSVLGMSETVWGLQRRKPLGSSTLGAPS
jgi:hypothetical protein